MLYCDGFIPEHSGKTDGIGIRAETNAVHAVSPWRIMDILYCIDAVWTAERTFISVAVGGES